ncbi:hypothetical protein LPMP_280980 [Leishmania panamensis]|uniref:EF-hand domain-containing protein n=1 Tax=Leishmania panamensis TaxID=5679 RepID=A0A088SDC2_LEIPA|nr:hypothetical protein LPMP_280980 [Leishmania panamensis]AIN99731.1 hypothetical protein LPMP_280980 [Leishmania panamensis]
MTLSRKADTVAGFRAEDNVFNTDDFKHALDIIVNLGNPPSAKSADGVYWLFELAFHCKKVLWDDWIASSQSDAFREFTESDRFRQAQGLLVKVLDMDGDGKITPKDFQIMYDTQLTPALDRRQGILNKWLPFTGQCVFGFVVGLDIGTRALNAYKGKYWIAGTGILAYTCVQSLAQQNSLNRNALENVFREKVRQLMDVNGDGEINLKDINALVENRMRFMATRLGLGGFSPGAAGYASLALGFLLGVRVI